MIRILRVAESVLYNWLYLCDDDPSEEKKVIAGKYPLCWDCGEEVIF